MFAVQSEVSVNQPQASAIRPRSNRMSFPFDTQSGLIGFLNLRSSEPEGQSTSQQRAGISSGAGGTSSAALVPASHDPFRSTDITANSSAISHLSKPLSGTPCDHLCWPLLLHD